MTAPSPLRLERAYQATLSALLRERSPEGYWTGELSTSALSTATAVSALSLIRKQTSSAKPDQDLIAHGLAWLAQHQNADGGWGDTVKSVSNISTTMLGRAAFHLAGAATPYADCLQRCEAYLKRCCGSTPEEQAEAIRARYGKDRTFAVPILTTCALAGLVSWREVTPLPFELACFPQSWFRFLRLPVVSYALPALIAIGQAVYHHRPPRNPITRGLRRLASGKSLRVLEAIQPSSGGFLEAVPLTSFVTLSLASIGLAEHPVAQRGAQFLRQVVRPDRSWPIDSNLSVWVTTLAINALAAAGELPRLERRTPLKEWLLRQQFTTRHPYTGADPGGWGWTHLPGSVPDADDTPGALLALRHLRVPMAARAVWTGLSWLRGLQNRDGGWPTFCRGWGNLPFDRSGSDLTAHALRALAAFLAPLLTRIQWQRVSARGLKYLARQQRPDGSWLPLWFGNQYAPNDENPTYGTARVLAAYRDLDKMDTDPARLGVAWLLAAQNPDGGWGGAVGVPSSIEETALAVEVLLDAGPSAEAAVNKGLSWLVQQVEAGGLENPTPIGFYFAKLWYFEKLYPIIHTVAALGRARLQYNKD
jgi:squalene-hopene/tetraprenyl-beta-curcumene cyclase